MAIDAGTSNIKALRVGSTVISRAFLGNQKIYDQLDYPTLDLNFALTKTLDPRITFTRASSGTFFDSNGAIQTAPVNTPRFDHNPVTGESLGLLIEEQRTNLFGRSEEFENAYWAKAGASVSSNATVAPNGATTADKLVENAAPSTIHQISRAISVTSGTVYTWSIYCKAAERSRIVLSFANQFPANSFAEFNLSAGTIASVGALGANNVTIQPLINGWYRLIATATASSTGFSTLVAFMSNGTSISYTGDGTSGIFFWGADLQAGAFATSYIPTTTTALTRAADVASVNTLSPWFNATTGAVFGEWNSFANSTVRYVVDIEQAASSNDRIDINIKASNVVNPRTVVGGAAIASLAGGTYTVNTNAKVAFAYASADYASSLNGAAAVTATTAGALPSSLARMFIGSLAGATQINGHLRRITYFNRRLANSELQLLSS